MAVLAVLTWYSGQNENNPFSKKELIQVIQKDNKLILVHIPKDLKNYPITIIAHEDAIPCVEALNKQTRWNLISGFRQLHSFCSHSVPELWKSIDITANSKVPKGWPQPSALQNIEDVNSISAKVIPISTDGATGLSWQIRGFSCLIIDSIRSVQELSLSELKEKFDLLILLNLSTEDVDIFRSTIRPRFLITTASDDKELKKFDNIFYLQDSTSEFNFEIQAKKLHFRAAQIH